MIPIFLRNEEEMTAANVARGGEMNDRDRPPVIRLPRDCLVEQRPERIGADDSDDERIVRRSEGRFRPVDESDDRPGKW